MTRGIDFRFVYLAVAARCMHVVCAEHGRSTSYYAKGSLCRRPRADKNTRRVCAVKKHDGARELGAESFTKLIDANDALIVHTAAIADSRFTPLARPAHGIFGTSNEISNSNYRIHRSSPPLRITGRKYSFSLLRRRLSSALSFGSVPPATIN
jgi:hypothetical protein